VLTCINGVEILSKCTLGDLGFALQLIRSLNHGLFHGTHPINELRFLVSFDQDLDMMITVSFEKALDSRLDMMLPRYLALDWSKGRPAHSGQPFTDSIFIF
jgi:hypothetical protein